MSELIVTLVRLGFLIALWLFVLWAMNLLRRDIYGTQVLARGSVHPQSRSSRAEPVRTKARRGVPSRLQITGGPLGGTIMRLAATSVVIGRAAGSSLVLDDDYVSGRHARFFQHNGAWYVEDLGSTNGTLHNDQPVTAPMEVVIGSQIRIGATTIELLR